MRPDAPAWRNQGPSPTLQLDACYAPLCPPTGADGRLRSGLQLLLDAIDYAADVEARPEEFAVDVSTLLLTGLVAIDVLWLTRKGFLARPAAGLNQVVGDCVHLTRAGESAARHFLAGAVVPVWVGAPLPVWDAARRELRWVERVVKRFRVPAPNQELILSAFQEEGWPPHIDDPLPQVAAVEPKRRLHDTITALNRHRAEPAVRFVGDGTGLGVRWEADGPAAKAS